MHAPLLIRQFSSAHAAVIGVAFVVTLQWKISLHCAGVAGIATLLTEMLGMEGVLAFMSVAMVAWSRIRLGRHTIPQALAGSAMGVLIFILALVVECCLPHGGLRAAGVWGREHHAPNRPRD